MKRSQEIEMNLSILNAITPKHWTWTQLEIAEICGCSQETINNISRSAFSKIRSNGLLEKFRHDLESDKATH